MPGKGFVSFDGLVQKFVALEIFIDTDTSFPTDVRCETMKDLLLIEDPSRLWLLHLQRWNFSALGIKYSVHICVSLGKEEIKYE